MPSLTQLVKQCERSSGNEPPAQWRYHISERPRECMDVLVMGTFNVFEAAVAAKVRKVVYASSASIYGAADEFPTDENHHPYNNRTLYGAAKAMNEGMARSFQDMYGLSTVG